MGHYQLDCGCYVSCKCDRPQYIYYCPETEDILIAFYKTRRTRVYSQMFGESEEIYYYMGEL